MIQLHCGQCGCRLQSSDGARVKFLLCPNCGSKVVLSSRPALPEPAQAPPVVRARPVQRDEDSEAPEGDEPYGGEMVPSRQSSEPMSLYDNMEYAARLRRQRRNMALVAFGVVACLGLGVAGLVALAASGRGEKDGKKSDRVAKAQHADPVTPPRYSPPPEPQHAAAPGPRRLPAADPQPRPVEGLPPAPMPPEPPPPNALPPVRPAPARPAPPQEDRRPPVQEAPAPKRPAPPAVAAEVAPPAPQPPPPPPAPRSATPKEADSDSARSNDAFVSRLCRDLKLHDKQTRFAAMDSLAKLGSKGKGASRTLCECLLDQQKEVMVKAAGTLREVNPELHDRVMPMMVDKEYQNRITALRQLGAMGEEGRPAVPILVYFKGSILQGGQAGMHPPSYVSNPHAGLVVEVLGAVAPKDLTWTKQLSIWFRTDTNPYVRAKAAGLLAQVDEAKVATELLVKKLAIETDLNVRLAIINALGAIGPDAREAEKALSARASADTSDEIRAAASRALKRIKGES
jgi:uncharacterized Zn finger protein (UPF0148 family)